MVGLSIQILNKKGGDTVKITTVKEYDYKITLMEANNIVKVKKYTNKVSTDLVKRFGTGATGTEDQYIKNKKSTMLKCASRIMDLVQCNAGAFKKKSGKPYPPIFLTLTFGENVVDFDVANYEHMKFIQRLNYYTYGRKCSELAYISVPELQDRGAVHYHILFFNLPYIDKEIVQDLWGHGWSRIEKETDKGEKLSDLDGISLGKYITKYMTKQFFSKDKEGKNHFYYDKEKWEGKKTYFTSRALYRPIISKIGKENFGNIDWVLEGSDLVSSEDIVKDLENGEQLHLAKVDTYKINEGIKAYLLNIFEVLSCDKIKTDFFLSLKNKKKAVGRSFKRLDLGKTVPIVETIWKNIGKNKIDPFVEVDLEYAF